MKYTSGIYKITQLSTTNIYVGSSYQIEQRWSQHKYALRRGTHRNKLLLSAWHESGEDDFVFEIIEECSPDKIALLALEQHYMDTLQPFFNIAPKAGSRLGSKASDETKARQSASMKGKNVGKVRSAETRAKLSEIALSMSDETKGKMAAAKLGGKATDETREKMRAAKLGKPKDPESIRKMIEVRSANRLRKLQEATASHLPGKRTAHKRVMSDDDVRSVLSSTEQDRVLADKYGCSAATIRKIRTRQIYKDVLL